MPELTAEQSHRIDQLVACGLEPSLSVTVSAYHLPDGPVVVRVDDPPQMLHCWLLDEAMRSHGYRQVQRWCPACAQRHLPRRPRLFAVAEEFPLVVGGFLFGWALSEAFSWLPGVIL